MNVRQRVAYLESLVQQRNLVISYENDFQTFTEMFGKIESIFAVQSTLPSFDPDYHDMDSNNSMWIKVMDQDRFVGCFAARLVETLNMKSDIQDLSVYFGHRLPNKTLDILSLYDSQLELDGKWSLGGKLWVDPTHRGSKLSSVLTYLIRAKMLERFQTAGHFCLLHNKTVTKGMDTGTYGYPRLSIPMLEVQNRDSQDVYQLFMNYIERDEILAEDYAEILSTTV